MWQFNDIVNFIKTLAIHEPVVDELSFPKAVKLHSTDLLHVCRELQRNENTYYDMLSCVTGIDNGTEAKSMEVVYHLYSIPYDQQLALKVALPRENPEIISLSSIWKTATWHEREVFDMFGIRFTEHPDLRRILMPADWEGHPLRKDYKQQEYYRGIKLDY